MCLARRGKDIKRDLTELSKTLEDIKTQREYPLITPETLRLIEAATSIILDEDKEQAALRMAQFLTRFEWCLLSWECMA